MTKQRDVTARRAARIRRSLKAAANGRARLTVHRSSKQIYAQLIDDAKGETLVAASSLEKELRGDLKSGATVAAATIVGKKLAERAKAKGVTHVVFDRSGYLF